MGSQPKSPNYYLISQLFLRFLVLIFTMSAILLIITTRQSNPSEESQEFYYINSPPMRFEVGTNAVVGGLSFVTMVLVYILKSPKIYPKKYFHLFLHDTVMTMLSISGCAVGTAEHLVAQYGQKNEAIYLLEPYCPQVQKYCQKMLIVLIFSYLAFACMFILTIITAHKLRVLSLHN